METDELTSPNDAPQPNHLPATVPASSDDEQSEKDLKAYHSGTGKIARLPEQIRNQVNQMLVDGHPHLDILKSIGHYAKGITPNNVSNWKTHGGFERWLQHRDTKTAIAITRDEAADIATGKPAAPLQEASRSLASAQIYETLRLFDPTALRSAIESKPQLYLQLVSSVSRLSEAEAACAHRQVQQALAQLKLEQAKAIDAAIQPDKIYTRDQMLEILRRIKIL